jgi:hypothetical protein
LQALIAALGQFLLDAADIPPQQPGQLMAGRVADVAPLPAEIFLLVRAQRQEASRHAVQVASVIFYLDGSAAARFSLAG